MRISQGRKGCLAAVAFAAFGAAKGASNVYVDFNAGFEGDFGSYAIISNIGDRDVSFAWTSSHNVTVKEIRLFSFNSRDSAAHPVACGKRAGDAADGQTLGPATCDEAYRNDYESFARGRRDPQRPGRASGGTDEDWIQLTVDSDTTGGQVTILSPGLRMAGADPLYFKAMWDGGYSYSRFFAFAANALNPDVRVTRAYPANTESGAPTAVPPTGLPSSATEDGNSDQTFSTASAASAASAAPTGNSDPSLGSGGSGGGQLTTPGGSAAVNDNGGGLAQGAIIGIAVGCGVAGLLAICGLVWYLLRRRQQEKALHAVGSPYGSGNRGEELMAEKEAGADVDVTPHSPYSDDGGAASGPAGPSGGGGAYPDAHGEAVAAGAVAAAAVAHPHLQDPPQSFTPYSDRPGAAAAAAGTPSVRAASVAQTTDEPRVRVPSPVPGRATPRGLTTPYAHLVEDGMTEDEIRRLEEEERQLDAAIEQAGRR